MARQDKAGCPLPWMGQKRADPISNVPKSTEVPQLIQRLGPGKGHGEGATHTTLVSTLPDMHSTTSTTWVP